MHKFFLKCLLAASVGLIFVNGTAMGAEYFTPNGQRVQGEMQGGRLFIVMEGRHEAASNGTYHTLDGNSIVVEGGAVQGGLNPNSAIGSIGPKPDDPLQANKNIRAIGPKPDDPRVISRIGGKPLARPVP